MDATTAITTSASAIGAIKAAVEFIKSLRKNSTSKELSSTLVEVLDKLLSVQFSVIELNEEIIKQSEELRKLKQTLAEKGNYTLVDLGHGQVVYKFNGTEVGKDGIVEISSHAPHYACQRCFDKENVRIVLIYEIRMLKDPIRQVELLTCKNCRTDIDVTGIL